MGVVINKQPQRGKTMNAKNVKLDNLAKAYILDCLTIPDAEGDHSTREVLEWHYREFQRVANHPYNLRRFPNQVDRLADYLQGLPSGFDIAFDNCDILELARQWGSLPENATEKQEYKILNNYWRFIANKFFQLCRKHGVDIGA